MYILNILFPWLAFFLRKRWKIAFVVLLLHVLAVASIFPTGLGFAIWLPLSAWAVLSYNYHKTPVEKQQNPKQNPAD